MALAARAASSQVLLLPPSEGRPAVVAFVATSDPSP
jgi:hypothetical protein